MFAIEKHGFFRRTKRLVSTKPLNRDDFYAIADSVEGQPFKAHKCEFVAARAADHPEEIETRWNGKETTNTAQAGDWIVTTLSPEHQALYDADGNRNTYVVAAEKFPVIYGPVAGFNEFGTFFVSKTVVDAIYLSGGFDIQAPWGHRQTAKKGYLLLNAGDVYGNNATTFDQTYEVLH